MSAQELRFVGREPELAFATRCLDAARQSRPQIVVIEGEAGIGKTAFLRQCIALAGDFVVLEATAEESEQSLEFGLVTQLLTRAATIASDDLPLAPPAGASANPFTAGAQLLGMLGALQEGGPVLVALDDVHWLDLASAAALLFALRRLTGDRLCVLMSTRPGALTGDRSGWARLLKDAEHVELHGLSSGEISLLASTMGRASLSSRSVERLRAHTDGHPLYVKTLLGELGVEALESPQAALPAPRSFASAVLARLATLSQAGQDLVAATAVAAGPHPVALIGAAAGVENPVAALDEALDADLMALVRQRAPLEVICAHPLVRTAVYDDLSIARRRKLHLAWARLTTGSAALTHRVAASHGRDDGLASELARAGQTAVQQGRMQAGIELLLCASGIAENLDMREDTLLRAVGYLGLAGDVRQSHALAADVAACRDSPMRSFILATQAASAGRLSEAIAALRAVTERPDYGNQPDLATQVESSLAIICAYAGQREDAVAWARRVIGDRRSPPTATLTARQAEALGLAMAGRAQEGVFALASLSEASIDSPLDVELLATRGMLKAWRGDMSAAAADLDAVIRLSRAGTAPRSLANAYSSLAEIDYHLGQWDEGLVHAELALTLAQDNNQIWELPFAHATASFLFAGRGDWPAANRHIQAAQRAAQRAPLPVSVYYACLAAANHDAIRGDDSGALAALARLRSHAPKTVTSELARRAWAIETRALINTRQPDQAARILDNISDTIDEQANREPAVHLWRLRGELAHARGRHHEAREAFRAGQDIAKAAHSPVAQGVLELAYGHVLRKTASRNAAADQLTAARERFQRLGARPFLQRCDEELAACGVRAGAAEDGYGLSAREQVIAKLVLAGKTNRQVAAQLYLSTKAVEYHLANIYAKTRVRSRHELSSRLTKLAAPKHSQQSDDSPHRSAFDFNSKAPRPTTTK